MASLHHRASFLDMPSSSVASTAVPRILRLPLEEIMG